MDAESRMDYYYLRALRAVQAATRNGRLDPDHGLNITLNMRKESDDAVTPEQVTAAAAHFLALCDEYEKDVDYAN